MNHLALITALLLPSWEGQPPVGPDPILFPSPEPVATDYRECPHPDYPELPAITR